MLLHYKNLGIVLCVVGRACDMLNSADLQDQQISVEGPMRPHSHLPAALAAGAAEEIPHGSAPGEHSGKVRR